MKIITGNPGTGKHTVAGILARKLELELVDVNKLSINEGVAEKNDQVLDVDVRKLKKILDKKMPKNALLVGHLAPYIISKSKIEIAVVLRRNPYNLEGIYKKRGYDKKKSLENLGSEIIGITYYDTIKNIGRKKTFQFDTTNKSVSSTVKKIESLFVKGKAEEDNVDWLKIVSEKRDLKRFFPY
ncbi:MAG: adenylate kinase family protein [Nitrosotalea sp.]